MGLRTEDGCRDQGLEDWDHHLPEESGIAEPSRPPLIRRKQPKQQQQSESLKCPRCGSDNTKFCYYNNYNKSQPRYYCKSCKRHWTKGGTLRNVPVGGGRKSKRPRNSTATTTSAFLTTAEPPRRQDHVSLLPFNNEGVSGVLCESFVYTNSIDTSSLHESTAKGGTGMITPDEPFLDQNLSTCAVNDDLTDQYSRINNFDANMEESSGSDMIPKTTSLWTSLNMISDVNLSNCWSWNWNGMDDMFANSSSSDVNISWDDVYAETKP